MRCGWPTNSSSVRGRSLSDRGRAAFEAETLSFFECDASEVGAGARALFLDLRSGVGLVIGGGDGDEGDGLR